MCRKTLVGLTTVITLFSLAGGAQQNAGLSLKPSAPTPALLPWAPQSDERWEPIETFKGEAPPLAAKFEKAIHTNHLGETMPYRLYRPKLEPGKKYPLVLFLHGSSGSGADNESQLLRANMFGSLVWALPKNQERHPCFILAPQSQVNWPPVKLVPDKLPEILPGIGAGCRQAVEIVEELLAKEPIDSARIYVTGHSMGGAGTWTLVSLRPDLFAAGVPVAGRANLSEVGRAAEVPIWDFHGLKDDVEPVLTSRAILATLQAAGGKPLYTEYEDVEHNSFMWAYTEPALVDWLFSQKKSSQAPGPATKAAPPPADDRAALEAAVRDYIDGWYEGDAARMARALHPDLAKRRVVTLPDGSMILDDATADAMVAFTKAGFGKKQVQAAQKNEVVILDISEGIATAKSVTPDFIDYIHLAKFGTQWKIVNVLWRPAGTPPVK